MFNTLLWYRLPIEFDHLPIYGQWNHWNPKNDLFTYMENMASETIETQKLI